MGTKALVKLSLFSLLMIGGGLSIRQIGTTRFFLFFHYESAYSTIHLHLTTYKRVGTLSVAKLLKQASSWVKLMRLMILT